MKQNLPIDLILLLLLVPAQIELFSYGDYFLIILLLLYTGLAIWRPLADLEHLPARFGSQRLSFLLRLFLLFLILLLNPIAVTIRNIQARLEAEAGKGNLVDAYLHMHDGNLQLEMAMEHLTNGVNPYVATYDHPLMSVWDPDIGVNPATEHLIYLPGLLLISLPFQQAVTAALGFYDQRLLYLLAYILVILFLPAISERPSHKLALMIGVGLNPWLAQPITWGMNDIVVVLCLLIAGLLLQRKNPLWAAVVLALACTMKQSAWLFVPFFLLTVYLLALAEKRRLQVVTAAALIAGLMLLVIGPFALWDLPAFIDDTFAYASGTAARLNYPIRGYTIGRLLLIGGTIQSELDYYPFWRWQLLFGLPAFALSLYYLWRQRTVSAMFLTASFFIFALGFVSRYFQDNYIGFVVTLALLGLFPTFPSSQANQAKFL
jgi:hypothetical protein